MAGPSGEAKMAATTINVVNSFSYHFPKLFALFEDCIENYGVRSPPIFMFFILNMFASLMFANSC